MSNFLNNVYKELGPTGNFCVTEKNVTIFRVKVPNSTVDDTYGGYHLSYEVKKLMYELGCIYFDVSIGFFISFNH